MRFSQADSTRAMPGHLGAVSLTKSHNIVISSFCNIVKGQAKYTLKCAYLIQNQYIGTTITIVFEGDMLEDVCAVI